MKSRRLSLRGALGLARWLVLRGSALKVLARLEPESVDLIATDPPYGVTKAQWDDAGDLEAWIAAMMRVIRPDGAVVLTASGTFATRVIRSAGSLLRYKLVWHKLGQPSGFLDANRRPLRAHEDVLVLGRHTPRYFPQLVAGQPYKAVKRAKTSLVYGRSGAIDVLNTGTRHPTDVLSIAKPPTSKRLHPTQKPVELMAWIIKSYSRPGELVMDPFCGSGTTGEAALREGRRFLGVERDGTFCRVARKRLKGVVGGMT